MRAIKSSFFLFDLFCCFFFFLRTYCNRRTVLSNSTRFKDFTKLKKDVRVARVKYRCHVTTECAQTEHRNLNKSIKSYSLRISWRVKEENFYVNFISTIILDCIRHWDEFFVSLWTSKERRPTNSFLFKYQRIDSNPKWDQIEKSQKYSKMRQLRGT